MAGFDAAFRVRLHDNDVVEACLAAAKRRARLLGVRLRIERPGSDLFYIAMDGQSYALDIFLERLRRDLPTIAEAGPHTKRSPAERRRVGIGLCDVLVRYRFSLYDRTPEDWIPTVRAKRESLIVTPHEVFPAKADPTLQARMFVTMDMLAAWHFREVAAEVLLEEIHTAAELLLEASVNRRSKRLSFRELVDLAHAQNMLTVAYVGNDPRLQDTGEPGWTFAAARNDAGRDVLISLKDCRKNVRHRGADGAETWLDTYFWDAASLLEKLAVHAE
jgi:hypothetical protein